MIFLKLGKNDFIWSSLTIRNLEMEISKVITMLENISVKSRETDDLTTIG